MELYKTIEFFFLDIQQEISTYTTCVEKMCEIILIHKKFVTTLIHSGWKGEKYEKSVCRLEQKKCHKIYGLISHDIIEQG